MLGLSLLFYGPMLYFLQQNYKLLSDLAYDVHPKMLVHLEQELRWIYFFSGASLLFILGFSFWIGITLTRRLIEPVIAIERHMQELVAGRWYIPDFSSRNPEFRELSLTYEYFYRALKNMTQEELKLLDQIAVDEKHREAWGTWKELINLKRRRIGLPDYEPVVESSQAQRQAS